MNRLLGYNIPTILFNFRLGSNYPALKGNDDKSTIFTTQMEDGSISLLEHRPGKLQKYQETSGTVQVNDGKVGTLFLCKNLIKSQYYITPKSFEDNIWQNERVNYFGRRAI